MNGFFPFRVIMLGLIVLLSVSPCSSYAYKEPTHETISRSAFYRSIVDDDFLDTLGIKGSNGSIDLSGDTALGWVVLGSSFEDKGTRSRNHFYNPLNKRGLSFGIVIGEPSPDWGLEDGLVDIPGQDYSYKDAREYYYTALTAVDEKVRNKNFADLFRTLGQVIHLLQDGAQPQHTRNDIHLLPDQAVYEAYTNSKKDGLPVIGYENVKLSKARDYFDSDVGKGVTEYSNKGFVSNGTNFSTDFFGNTVTANGFPLPSPLDLTAGVEEDVSKYYPGSSGTLTFLTGNVFDSYTITDSPSVKISSRSLFSDYIDTVTTELRGPIYTLNNVIYDDYQSLLIKRAVGYSAGMIDYFFRGRLSAEDFDLSGSEITLKIKNDTIWNEAPVQALTSGGKVLIAIEYTNGGSKVFTKTNQLTISRDIDPNKVSLESYTFSLPNIPVSAVNVKYRLVYRGFLGNEKDAIAIGSIDFLDVFIGNSVYRGLNTVFRIDRDGVIKDRITLSTNHSVGVSTYGDKLYYTDRPAIFENDVVIDGSLSNGNDTAVTNTHILAIEAAGSNGASVNVHIYDRLTLSKIRTISTNSGFANLGGQLRIAANDTHFATAHNDNIFLYTIGGTLVRRISGVGFFDTFRLWMTHDRLFAVYSPSGSASLHTFDMDGNERPTSGINTVFYGAECTAASENLLYIADDLNFPAGGVLYIYNRKVTRNETGEITSDVYSLINTISLPFDQPTSCGMDKSKILPKL